MQITSLTVSPRQTRGKGGARQTRAAGRIPAIVYGEKADPVTVSVDAHAFDALLRAGGHHGLVEVVFGDGGEAVKALVREMQIHPVSRAVEHIDLQRVDMSKRIHLSVQVALIGKPEGVRNQGGILEHHLREVELECLPLDIPEVIEVDVTNLEVGQAIHVSDLKRDGVTFLTHPDTTVATVSLPAAERSTEEIAAEAAAAAAAAAPAEGAAPEGEGKGEGEGKAEGKPEGKEAKGKGGKGGAS